MNRALRFVPFVVVVTIAAVAFGAGAASGGNGSTILRGQFQTIAAFVVNGNETVYLVTCNEQRVQKPDGSASESATCQLDPGETPPDEAAHMDQGWESDFFVSGVPGFLGGFITFDVHGVLTPSGNANISMTYAAP